ncbi:hypothetical protein [Salidesulfovibrio onnuriiensis]|uniref:hypothetical protein n=1 Tax=Salidesulfovibrio onnuriiensis TaxID=2583823 RepID=UPI0011CA4DC7|nr:hypothetical protein [Salidesulfovibrio onnuriiensis]
MNIEVVRVVYSPSEEKKQAEQKSLTTDKHVDEAMETVGRNAAEKRARILAQEQVRREQEMAEYAESIKAHQFNMDRVMDLLSDPALSDIEL